MREKIVAMCEQIEKSQGVEILFAVENGSRAWQMESADSDYDVRFVFKRPIEAYVSLKSPRDVIEVMDGDIDLVGFDVFKFLSLLSKSNPTMIEWLVSDMVYCGEQPEVLRQWIEQQANWQALYHHYRSLCNNNFEKYIVGGKGVTGKKYLYVFRGLINARFVERFQKVPPIVLIDALSMVGLPDAVVVKLKELIELKRSGRESDIVDRVELFDEVVESFLDSVSSVPARKSDVTALDDFLRGLLLSKRGG